MAIATSIPVRVWADETDEIIATAVAVLEEQQARTKKKG